MDEPNYEIHLFKPVQPLFPSFWAPCETRKISVNLQFIVPNLRIAKSKKDNYYCIINKCLDGVWRSDIRALEDKEKGGIATLVEVAFCINESERDYERIVQNKSRLLIERFLGIVSFSAGKKLSAINIVYNIKNSENYKMLLRPAIKTETPRNEFTTPKEFYDGRTISDEIFSALFWLRRGLAEGDPIDTYNAFMVCLQILAKDWWHKKIASGCVPYEQPPMKCPYCKNDLPRMGNDPSITSIFREYIVREFGASKKEVKDVWGFRNAIAAHGNEPKIDADDFIKITELKFN
jgi:hypothetical protein